MADSLTANVKTVIAAASAFSYGKHLATVRSNAGVVHHITRSSTVKQYDEPTPAQSMAVKKILGLPKLNTP